MTNDEQRAEFEAWYHDEKRTIRLTQYVTARDAYQAATAAADKRADERVEAMRERVRTALVAYIDSEGCDCCRDREAHSKAETQLAELLGTPRYDDDSGWDWSAAAIRERGGDQPAKGDSA